jgi:hypothetical protein
LVVAPLAAYVIWRWFRKRDGGVCDSPSGLLADLCAVHNLTIPQRRLVARLVRHHSLVHPGKAFVEPNLWDARELGELGRRNAPEIDALRRRLFEGRSARQAVTTGKQA